MGYDGKKELGNSLNCKSYSLNPRRLSLNWEKRKKQQQQPSSSSGPPDAAKDFGTSLEAAQNVGLTHKRVYGSLKSSSILIKSITIFSHVK